jgi:beta-lactam-binding protein with PASTA domain
MANADLLIGSSTSIEDNNYFLVTLTDLDLDKRYPVQFRWKYADGSNGAWSTTYNITTPNETLPNRPKFTETSVAGGAGFLTVTWDGKDNAGNILSNIDRVEVYIAEPPFNGGVVATFKAAGTQTIAAPHGDYTVGIYSISSSGTKSELSSLYTVTVTSVLPPVTAAEVSSAPQVSSGLASLVVSWDGKNSAGINIKDTSFNKAKVYVGTTPTFTPSDNNWVHTMGFANGLNKVSIGVGTIINKSTFESLQYGVPYYVKFDTVNANGVSSGTPVSAFGNPITVSKLPASEIATGILTADATITAGVAGGARAVLSSSSSPFVIYGSDGTTKLLEFLSGPPSSLNIIGSGTFTGELTAGSNDDIFRVTPSQGIWLGNRDYTTAPFRVSVNGALKATSGNIGQWSIAPQHLQSKDGKITLNSDTGIISIGSLDGKHLRLSSDSGIATYDGGSATGAFSLSTSGNLRLKGEISIKGTNDVTTTNFWNESLFKVGNEKVYIQSNINTGEITLASLRSQQTENTLIDGLEYVGGSKIKIDETQGIQIFNLPILGNSVTTNKSLSPTGAKASTQYKKIDYPNAAWTEWTNNWGSYARQRAIVQDPYTNMLKRGFGIYYGNLASYPTAATGYVGDIWIEWDPYTNGVDGGGWKTITKMFVKTDVSGIQNIDPMNATGVVGTKKGEFSVRWDLVPFAATYSVQILNAPFASSITPNTSLTVTTPTRSVSFGNAGLGISYQVRVTALHSDGHALATTIVTVLSAAVDSDVILKVLTNPVISGGTKTGGGIYSGDTLSITSGEWEGSGDITYTYRWYSPSNTTLGTASTQFVSMAYTVVYGDTIYCEVTATDDISSKTVMVSATVYSKVTAPDLTAIGITGQTAGTFSVEWTDLTDFADYYTVSATSGNGYTSLLPSVTQTKNAPLTSASWTNGIAGTLYTISIVAKKNDGTTVDTVTTQSRAQYNLLPNFVGGSQPSSVSGQYNITIGATQTTTNSALAGTVYSQSVAAGTPLNSVLTVVISMYALASSGGGTTQTFTVPSFVGQSQPSSTSTYNIAIGGSTKSNSPDQWGLVASQSPTAGSTANVGSTITISVYVSSPVVPTFTVPNFISGGIPASTSKYTIVTSDKSGGGPTSWGTVASQSPAAGTIAEEGITISVEIWVSSGPSFFSPPLFFSPPSFFSPPAFFSPPYFPPYSPPYFRPF